MIDERSLQAVASSRWGDGLRRPRYAGYAFSQIPATVRGLLADEPDGVPLAEGSGLRQRYDAIALVLVDGLGWRFFTRYAEHPFLRRFVDQGLVAQLTTQFPSTTSAHLTAIHTGLPPSQSGVFEWFMYEPSLDRVIAPLLFSYAGDTAREGLQGQLDPAALFPQRTLYQQLARLGVESTVLAHQGYARSSFSRAMAAGATIAPFYSLAEGLVNMCEALERPGARRYAYLYFDGVDAISHRYGPDSPQAEAEILALLDTLERQLHERLLRAGRRTLLLLTADHGQTTIDPATTIALNVAAPEILALLRNGRDGRPLAPAGSPRDMFLYLRPGALDDARALLERHLAGRALVVPVAELIDQGLFGPHPGPLLRARAGDLAILPHQRESVWWYERGRYEQRYYGHHGGLLPEEAETQLLGMAYGGER